MIPVTFIIGAAVGAAVTYVYKDDTSKTLVKQNSKKMKEKMSSLMAVFKKKPENEVVSGEVENVPDVAVETVTKA